MNDDKARALVVAGRLLQAQDWPFGRKKIEKQGGESYPEAVLRTARGLPQAEQDHLRSLTAWILDYESSGVD